ncbi:MAG: hypothetical protein L6435_07850 [Anaerolineae bacterium]|nr:hypothetical protein [Anaerolineae bacterium]
MSREPATTYRTYRQEVGSNRPGASRVDLRAVGFIAALLVLVGLCGILYVGQASKVYVLRHSLWVLGINRVEYYQENAYLRSQIARTGASENLSLWARELGYMVVGEPHYIAFSYAPLPSDDTREDSFAMEERPPLAGEGAEEGVAARVSRWGEDVLNQFREWIDLAAIKAKEAQ